MMTGFLRRHLFTTAILVALIQCGVLVWMIQDRASILRNGTEIVLKTEPVDPRDLLRGDYATLGYELSKIPASEITGYPGASYTGGSVVFVVLKKGADDHWVKSRVSAEPVDDLRDGEVLLKGRARYTFRPQNVETVRVDYGIERFYVPEGKGRLIEDAQRQKRINAVVMVDKKGRAQIKALRDNGVLLYEEPLY
jgi:uncharacterized membrane-anchored protein